MSLDQQIDRGEASLAEMSAAIKDLQRMRDHKEAQVMKLRRQRHERKKDGKHSSS